MNVEDLARRAGNDLRQATATDVESAWEDLGRALPRRRRARVAAAACAVVAVLVLVTGTTRWLLPEASRVGQPSKAPGVSRTLAPTPQPPGQACDVIPCHGRRHQTIALPVTMDWTLPKGFQDPHVLGASEPTAGVETFLNTGEAGLAVLQGVSPAKNQAEPAAVPGIATAESFANWIAQRPFLSASPVRTGHVDGLTAWIVDVEVPPGLPAGPATCAGRFDCYPVLLQGSWVAGAWRNVTGRYTFVDLPGVGVTVLWSWALDGAAIPKPVDDLVGTIRFQ